MENDKNQLIPINNSLAGFERQIAIGEKLLGLKLSDFEKEKIKEFLIEIVSDNYNVTNIISGYFPLTDELIQKFKYQLNWGWLCNNEYVVFTEELIDKYFNFIDWESISYNPHLNWNERLLSKYSDYLNFNTLFLENHPNLKVTFNLYEKFKNKIDIENLEYFDFEFEFAKEFITEDIDIINWENLKSYTVENLELFEDKINWDDLSQSKKLTLTDELIERFKYRWSWDEIIKIERKNGVPAYIRVFETRYSDGIYTNIYYDAGNVIDEEFLNSLIEHSVWSHLSRDTNFANNFTLIQKFENQWNWALLTKNDSIKWTYELIKKYKNKIDWEVFSLNPHLQWSEDLIELYLDYWDWKTLGMNIFLPWNLDFYKKYENKFQLDFLFFHKEFHSNSNDYFMSNGLISSYFVEHHMDQNIPRTKFNENLIFYLKDILDWNLFSRFYEWSLTEIDKYDEYINWESLSKNRNINWSVELVDKLLKKYEDKWDRDWIGWNKLITDFSFSALTKYVNYIKKKDIFSERLTSMKIRNLFLMNVDENDVIKILEDSQKYNN